MFINCNISITKAYVRERESTYISQPGTDSSIISYALLESAIRPDIQPKSSDATRRRRERSG